MRLLLISILTGSIFIASCSIRQPALSVRGANIKIMSYNVHHCNPPTKPGIIDIDAIAAVINSAMPDIVGLQEIDVRTGRSGKDINQAQELAKKTGMNFFFGKAIDHYGGEYGVALLSKYSIDEAMVYQLPSLPGTNGEKRILITAKLVLPSGKAIRFGNTHLDAQKNSANRMAQIKEINTIAGKETLPFIITGDFNAYPESDVIKEMDLVFKRSCLDCKPTIPADKPVRSIDFIGFLKNNPIEIKAHEVISASEASDHLPVVAVLQLK